MRITFLLVLTVCAGCRGTLSAPGPTAPRPAVRRAAPEPARFEPYVVPAQPFVRGPVARTDRPAAPDAFVTPGLEGTERRSATAKGRSMENLRTIAALIMTRARAKGWKAFPYSGKNFVLASVAHGDLDPRIEEELGVLFSPGQDAYAPDKIALSAYGYVTRGALRGGVDFHRLTSYAGRRNAEREYRLTASDLVTGTPIVADLSFPDVALVAFTNGEVRQMGRAALGLGPEDPIVVGDDSKSRYLQPLSDE